MRGLGLALFTLYDWKMADSRDKPFSADIGCFFFLFLLFFATDRAPSRHQGEKWAIDRFASAFLSLFKKRKLRSTSF